MIQGEPAAVVYRVLADTVLVLHLGVVAFVVCGLVLIVAGNRSGWHWVNGAWFRGAHLGAILVVVAESWFGLSCPLTTLESWLREQAGTVSHDTGFIEYWVQRLLFHDAPPWVFVAAYTGFALLVIAAWWRYPPQWRRQAHKQR